MIPIQREHTYKEEKRQLREETMDGVNNSNLQGEVHDSSIGMNEARSLRDYIVPNIQEIEPSIQKPVIKVNNFEIKPVKVWITQ